MKIKGKNEDRGREGVAQERGRREGVENGEKRRRGEQ
jgi:hypothetical protein